MDNILLVLSKESITVLLHNKYNHIFNKLNNKPAKSQRFKKQSTCCGFLLVMLLLLLLLSLVVGEYLKIHFPTFTPSVSTKKLMRMKMSSEHTFFDSFHRSGF